jgi:uncharacterized small protein (DUF1192 family)
LILAVLTVLFSPACLSAQQATDAGAAKQLTDAVVKLSEQVTNLSDRVVKMQQEIADLKGQRQAGNQGRTTTAMPAPATAGTNSYVTREEFQTLQAQVKANTDVIDSVDDRLAVISKENAELLAQIQEQNAAQSQMLAAISTQGAGGNPIPNLRAIMDDSQGRESLENAVHQVLRRQGTVTIENRLGQGYSIEVNRQAHFVPAGGGITISNVPVGTVTTELVGYEETKYWAITPPDYQLKIVIGPRERQVVRRVAEAETMPQVVTPAVPVATPVVANYRYYYDPALGWVLTP